MLPIRISGRVTADGRLVFTPPAGLPEGEVEITIQAAADEQFTDEEIAEALQSEPLSGTEIIEQGLTGTWADMAIDDPVAFVDDLRHHDERKLTW
jgi:hypothetical protein